MGDRVGGTCGCLDFIRGAGRAHKELQAGKNLIFLKDYSGNNDNGLDDQN